ncbi:hypothetical protein AXF42_Ash021142 [Apostasia shenzhenica]|uniref:Uncharacterized protein n=1 Tax=Apostasia shenzhenica TaxID=1088818 RepID=A0A2I0ADX9_9ASPA|nr:hypothetical protein AXF42_Ash021142 [Apostasia shenzhenica]
MALNGFVRLAITDCGFEPLNMLAGVGRASVSLKPGEPEVLWDWGQPNDVGKGGIAIHRSKEKIRPMMRGLNAWEEGISLGKERRESRQKESRLW